MFSQWHEYMQALISLFGNVMESSLEKPECLIEVACSFQVLADNLIKRLPVNLGKLQSIKVMTLDGNQIACLPDECNILL